MIKHVCFRSILRLLCAGVAAVGLLAGASGCQFLGMAYENVAGTPMAARYTDLAKKSVMILVYTDGATEFEYPQARQEISSFLSAELRKHLPKSKLLKSSKVIAYQNNTQGWQALPIKTIGKHFGVDRVLYIEVVDFTAHAPGAPHLMQGHIRAHVAIYNTHLPGGGRVFATDINTLWPKAGPEPVYHTNSNVVMYNALTHFSRSVVQCFYNWTAHPL